MAEKQSSTQTLLDKMSAEVTPATSPLLEFLTRNAGKIGIAIAVCLVAAVGYGVYAWQDKQATAKAQDDLARIIILPEAADRLAKLKEFLPSAPAGLQKSVNLAIARAAAQAESHADAYQAWDALSKDTKDPLYVTAMVGKAESLSLQGKAAETLTVLESIPLADDSEAANMVNALIVSAAEKAGDMKKALAVCEKLIPGMAARSPEEAEYWRQKAAALRIAILSDARHAG